jgi:hypothetical protein
VAPKQEGKRLSLQLLDRLNSGSRGHFRRFLDRLDREPRICWYPSAGHDFRDLLYLTKEYTDFRPATGPEDSPPEVFLHTDYYPREPSRFLHDRNLLPQDTRTKLVIEEQEILGNIDLPRHCDLVHFPQPNAVSGRVIYMRLRRSSSWLGELSDAHLLYAFVENAAICDRILLPEKALISHIVHVRYGGGFGGGTANGAWLAGVLRRLRCGTLISDGTIKQWYAGDHRAVRLFPDLVDRDCPPEPDLFRQIRVIPERLWSDHGDVRWLRTGL